MIKDIYFESERLKTSQLTEGDALSLFQIYSDSDAMKFRGSKPMEEMSDAYKMIAEHLTVKNQISKLRLGIRNKSNNVLIGSLLLTWNENVKNQCEIGFSFGRNYWRQGFGKETLTMIEKQLGTDENLDTITACCIKENQASINIFERAGFLETAQNEFPESILFVKKIK